MVMSDGQSAPSNKVVVDCRHGHIRWPDLSRLSVASSCLAVEVFDIQLCGDLERFQILASG